MKHTYSSFLLVAAALLSAAPMFAQSDIQFEARHMPGWDPRAREGRCEIRVWVDNRVELRMRGERVYVRTLEGARSRDDGSQCSQPLPYNLIRDFQVRQTAGRNRVSLTQEPTRLNNYTAMVDIDDRQGGGDSYVFEVTWRSDGAVDTAPAPFFDDVRACQDTVRQSFLTQNGRGAYINFADFADRQGQSMNADNRQGRGRGRGRYRNSTETIQGTGSARSRNESIGLTYSCVIDPNQGQVISGTYQYTGTSVRTNERTRLK